MQSESVDGLAQTLFHKATAVGLTNVMSKSLHTHIINYQMIGQKTESSSDISFKGSNAQESAFKASLVGAEAENLSIERFEVIAGDDCPDFKVFNLSTGEEVHLHWAIDDPKVYLLDFWATWCGPCQKPMAHNEEILERNPDWENKAEILTISLDDEKAAPVVLIQEKGWNKMKNYWGGEGGFSSPGPALFKVNGIPTCLLVKKGKVLWRGHPSERDLETDITHLIINEDLPITIEAFTRENDSPVLLGQELEEKLAQVESVLREFLTEHPNAESPFFVYILTTRVTADGQTLKGRAISGGSFPTTEKPVIERVLERLKVHFPKIQERFRYT